MCAHITVPYDELLVTQLLLYLSQPPGFSPEPIAKRNLVIERVG
jgi:hypothetical protein